MEQKFELSLDDLMKYGSLILKLEIAHSNQNLKCLEKYSDILIYFFLTVLKLDKNAIVLLLNKMTELVDEQINKINNQILEKLN